MKTSEKFQGYASFIKRNWDFEIIANHKLKINLLFSHPLTFEKKDFQQCFTTKNKFGVELPAENDMQVYRSKTEL